MSSPPVPVPVPVPFCFFVAVVVASKVVNQNPTCWFCVSLKTTGAHTEHEVPLLPFSALARNCGFALSVSACTADIFPSSPPHSSVYFPVRQSYFVNISHRTSEPFQIADCSKMPPNKLWCKGDIRNETEVGKKEINLHKYAYVTTRPRMMVEMSARKYRFIMM